MTKERKGELPRPALAERDRTNTIGQNAADSAPTQKPSSQELKRIVARHVGWLAIQESKEIPESDIYLEKVEPPYLGVAG